ncbi:TetR/AcrR family transcriptional regulator [Periweissella fabaria]|uniref:HTH tetR-type domain-containing protein n=1 Tax=Periweissella fabaria TaxID=546157 RepID=A0ABM8Z6C3_9LACO|nr:TetR/AcrR family transcriptional regulator [Periweissella fabaria]MCM0597560.1 TetR/AcrR family transcriptional regulator [Periweissella fabaria]CAH0416743.1 hypothetical protein WFA24289_01055 [Periweissella fabaria]
MKKYEQTHQKILTVAEELLVSNQKNKVSVEKISNAARINRSTFYRHFPAYNDLIGEIVRVKLSEISNEPNGVVVEMQRIFDVIEGNFKLFQHILNQVDDFKYVFQQLLFERIKYIGLTNFRGINLESPAEAELIYRTVVAIFSAWIENPTVISKEDIIIFAEKHYLNTND